MLLFMEREIEGPESVLGEIFAYIISLALKKTLLTQNNKYLKLLYTLLLPESQRGRQL